MGKKNKKKPTVASSPAVPPENETQNQPPPEQQANPNPPSEPDQKVPGAEASSDTGRDGSELAAPPEPPNPEKETPKAEHDPRTTLKDEDVRNVVIALFDCKDGHRSKGVKDVPMECVHCGKPTKMVGYYEGEKYISVK